MKTVKLSSKWQIVIPKNIRDELHLSAGTEFIISKTATGLTLTPISIFAASTAKEVHGILAKSGRHLPTEADLKTSIKARLKLADKSVI